MLFRRLSAALALAAILSVAVSSTAFAAHPVHKTGSGDINQTAGADIDNGTFNQGTDADDVWFIAHTSTFRVITYNNHIFNKIVKVASKPSYATCTSAIASAPNSGFNEYKAAKNVGHWFCFLTSENRYARVQITKVNTTTGARPMSIVFTTWCKPTDGC